MWPSALLTFDWMTLNAALFAYHASVLKPLVFPPVTFVILGRTKYLGTEKTIPLRLEGPIVYSFRLLLPRRCDHSLIFSRGREAYPSPNISPGMKLACQISSEYLQGSLLFDNYYWGYVRTMLLRYPQMQLAQNKSVVSLAGHLSCFQAATFAINEKQSNDEGEVFHRLFTLLIMDTKTACLRAGDAQAGLNKTIIPILSSYNSTSDSRRYRLALELTSYAGFTMVSRA